MGEVTFIPDKPKKYEKNAEINFSENSRLHKVSGSSILLILFTNFITF